jgi:hypothetical protein
MMISKGRANRRFLGCAYIRTTVCGMDVGEYVRWLLNGCHPYERLPYHRNRRPHQRDDVSGEIVFTNAVAEKSRK